MKFLPLIWAGLWRKKIRTVLTLMSIVVAFALFGLMEGVTAGLDDAIEGLTDESRLMVQSRVNIIEPLPIAYVPRIQSVDGIDEIAYYGYFGGFFQEPRNQINTGAVNIDAFFDMYPEFIVPPEQLEAMMRTRNGALVGADLLERFGWSIGDRIPLGSTIWSTQAGTNTWEFEIAGVFTTDTGANQDDFYIHYDYFDEERTAGNGTVALYLVKVDDVARSDQISDEIDSLFLNSANETQTMNEREFTRAQIAQIGDINFFVNAIAGAVMFTLLFLTGNTMMQSVRERIPELAVLKTYGFSDTSLTVFICAESLLLCLAAALTGLGIAAAAFPSVFDAMGILPLPLPLSVVEIGCGIAAALAIVSALPPAVRARRLSIVDALAGR
ncbi:MAG: ABC transporter permease [Gammaproteobacteria bacterium]|jgi:putative ABC transport system permease protein